MYESYFSNVQPMAWFKAKQVRLLGLTFYKGDKEQGFCASEWVFQETETFHIVKVF